MDGSVQPAPVVEAGEGDTKRGAVFGAGRAALQALVGTAYKLGPNTDPVRFPFIAPIEGSDQSLLGVANGVETVVEPAVKPGKCGRGGGGGGIFVLDVRRWGGRLPVSTADRSQAVAPLSHRGRLA